MNKEDEKLIADYMGWKEDELLIGYRVTEDRMAHFDLNDAGLCVRKMCQNGDWFRFLSLAHTSYTDMNGVFPDQFIEALFDAENFFATMIELLREEKKFLSPRGS